MEQPWNSEQVMDGKNYAIRAVGCVEDDDDEGRIVNDSSMQKMHYQS